MFFTYLPTYLPTTYLDSVTLTKLEAHQIADLRVMV